VVQRQQKRIEDHEGKIRAPNLVISGVPEGRFRIGKRELSSDLDKVAYMFEKAEIDAKPSDIAVTQRLGRMNDQRSRPLKVAFKDKENKFLVLNKRKLISQNEDLVNTFGGKIFVNADNSFLVRKEEYRMRQKIKRLKTEHPNDRIYLRSGSLYHNTVIIDHVNVENCLF